MDAAISIQRELPGVGTTKYYWAGKAVRAKHLLNLSGTEWKGGFSSEFVAQVS